ncbi:hypothetical protein [Phycicoccus sp. Root101]|uniref:hypothetical protein n=1 Tax=Phycicoccus sp. Root101 TaxID=1736421 RepID=UPI00070392DC|nr:hypothetical protein [Phycicoccus sp. Root101]
MRTFDVTARSRRGGLSTCNVPADNAGEAVALVRSLAPTDATDVTAYAVYRQRRVRGRRLVGLFAGPGADGGPAGVREPRRPRPAPPGLEVHAIPPTP